MVFFNLSLSTAFVIKAQLFSGLCGLHDEMKWKVVVSKWMKHVTFYSLRLSNKCWAYTATAATITTKITTATTKKRFRHKHASFENSSEFIELQSSGLHEIEKNLLSSKIKAFLKNRVHDIKLLKINGKLLLLLLWLLLRLLLWLCCCCGCGFADRGVPCEIRAPRFKPRNQTKCICLWMNLF